VRRLEEAAAKSFLRNSPERLSSRFCGATALPLHLPEQPQPAAAAEGEEKQSTLGPTQSWRAQVAAVVRKHLSVLVDEQRKQYDENSRSVEQMASQLILEINRQDLSDANGAARGTVDLLPARNLEIKAVEKTLNGMPERKCAGDALGEEGDGGLDFEEGISKDRRSHLQSTKEHQIWFERLEYHMTQMATVHSEYKKGLLSTTSDPLEEVDEEEIVAGWDEEIDITCLAADLVGSTGDQIERLVAFSTGRAHIDVVHPKHPDAHPLVWRIVTHRSFELTVSFIILVNSIFIGVASEYAINNLQDQAPWGIYGMELFFHAFFVSELCAKVYVFRISFFIGRDLRWNNFDAFLVLAAMYDVITPALAMDDLTNGNVTFLRSFRLLKLLKVFRLIRVLRFFRELRLMLYSIVESGNSLLWALLLVTITLYLFSLIFIQGVTHILADRLDLSENTVEAMYTYWGSVGTGMTSIWMSISGGVDWGDIAEPLKEAGIFYYGLFVLIIAFLTIAMLNILTGIFVGNALEVGEEDRQNVEYQQAEKSKKFNKALKDVFCEADEDGSGTLSWTEFSEHVKTPAMQGYLHALELDIKDVAFFFKVISHNSPDGNVDIDEFLSGCTRLKGSVRMLDIESLSSELRVLSRAQAELADFITIQFQRLIPNVVKNPQLMTIKTKAFS